MKTMSAMYVRRHFGAVLDDVRLKAETVLLERAGRPIALITPLPSAEENTEKNIQALKNLSGVGGVTERGRNLDEWMNKSRLDRAHG